MGSGLSLHYDNFYLLIIEDIWIIIGSSKLDREDNSWVGENMQIEQLTTRRGQLWRLTILVFKKVHKFVTDCSRVGMSGKGIWRFNNIM